VTEDDCRQALRTLAAKMPVTDMGDVAVARARQLQWRRNASEIAVVAVIIASAIAVPLTVLAGPNRSQPVATGTRSMGTEPVGAAFQVGDPPMTVIGGLPNQDPTCQPDQVTGSGTFQRTADGVAAVVDLSSTAECVLLLGSDGPRLLAADGTTLPVQDRPDPDKTNPATYNAAWVQGPRRSLGFAWNGSWCGPAPQTVMIALQRGAVTVPVNGPSPVCNQTSDSRIIVGSQDYRQGPVQPAPPRWRYLTARLSAPASVSGPDIHGMTVTLVNSSAADVPLNPRPRYCIGVRDRHGDGTQCERLRPLFHGNATLQVPANSALTLPLPTQSIREDWQNLKGKAITLTFTMTGVPNSTTTTTTNRAASSRP
jgi:hypothetical protein